MLKSRLKTEKRWNKILNLGFELASPKLIIQKSPLSNFETKNK